MAHPHLKEARDGAESKLRRIAGFHGTRNHPSGNESTMTDVANGPPGVGLPKGTRTLPLSNPVMAGKKPKARLDKFAKGGRAKHKGTNVNVIIGHPGAGGPPPPPPMAGPALPVPRPAAPPMMPPPGMPPGAMGAPGMPPPGLGGLPPGGLPPGALPIRKHGGRVAKHTAPQYPQKVKTAHAQNLGPHKRGGKVRRKYDNGGDVPPVLSEQMNQPAQTPPLSALQSELNRPYTPEQYKAITDRLKSEGKLRRGGKVHHADEVEDRAMIRHMVKPGALKRAKGGRAHYDAGSGSGEGRIEKVEHYGRKAHMKPKAV